MMQRVGRTTCSIFIDVLKVKQLCWKQVSYRKSIITGGLGFFFWLHSYLDINKGLAGQGTENIVFLNSKRCSLESYKCFSLKT